MSTLGHQCLQCKKRRVKCDSTTPTCSKCEKDGYECPGYTKALTWVHVKPTPEPKLRKKFRDSKGRDSSTPSGSSPATDAALECLPRRQDLEPLQVKDPEHTLVTDPERRAHIVLEAVFYYNTEICSDLSAVHWLGKQTIDTHKWLLVPAAFQNIIIVAVLSTKALRLGHDTKRQMYSYRGSVINDLARHLKEPGSDPPWMSLGLVLGMLSLEVCLSPMKDFTIHLVAARAAVASYGGVTACMRRWPGFADLISLFVATDVVSTTTTPVSSLEPESVSIQPDHLYAINNFEDCLLDSVFPCPVAIFEAIISINKLRLLSRTATQFTPTWQSEILKALEDIQSFNPWQWANQLDCLPEDVLRSDRLEAANDWATLASCYQSGTIIYLLESMRSQDLLTITNMEGLGAAIVNDAWQQLQHDLRYLFQTYPSRQARPNKPCLWRFCLWPLIVYTYGSVALPGSEGEDHRIMACQPGQRTLFDGLREVGARLGSHAMMHGADLLERLSKSGRTLTWDKAFAESSIFYV